MTGRCNSCGVTAIRRRIGCLPAGMSLMLCATCYYDHTFQVIDYRQARRRSVDRSRPCESRAHPQPNQVCGVLELHLSFGEPGHRTAVLST